MSDIDNDNTINNDTINNDKDNPTGSIGTLGSCNPNNIDKPAGVAAAVYTDVDTVIQGRRTSDDGPRVVAEHLGVYGYVYKVTYANGTVGLMSTHMGRTRSQDYAKGMLLSVSDWRQCRTVIGGSFEPDNPSDSMTTAHWYSETGAQIYHIDTGCLPRSPLGFLLVSSCLNREYMMVCRGLTGYGLFQTTFFVQWCDWQAMQGLFSQVDNAIRADRVYETYGALRKRLVYDDAPIGMQIGVSAIMRTRN